MLNNHTTIAAYYASSRDELIGFMAARLGDRAMAEDMVQDLFLRLLASKSLITPQTLPCLAYTMARHMLTDYYRHRRACEEYEHYVRRSDVAGDSPESVYSARQIVERMERSLARLPESCRKVYRLHIYGGLKVGEISRQLNEPYKSVEHQLGRARKAVRHQLRLCV